MKKLFVLKTLDEHPDQPVSKIFNSSKTRKYIKHEYIYIYFKINYDKILRYLESKYLNLS